MSAHPNTLLIVIIRNPEKLVLDEDDDINIDGELWSYSEQGNDYQVGIAEDEVCIHKYLTYGYEETISLEKLLQEIDIVACWCKHKGLDYEIRIGANYW